MASSATPNSPLRTCLCSPTTHPGSFRCSFHRAVSSSSSPSRGRGRARTVRVSSSKQLILAMQKVNSIRAFLLQIIKPSNHGLRRRRNFRPQPSRFGREGVAVS